MVSRLSQDSHKCHIHTNISNEKIKIFKEHAVTAIVKEKTQLENMNVVGPETPIMIPPKQKRK